MKDRTRDCIEKTVDLYQGYHGKGNGRIQIYFGLRQLMSCSEELIRLTGDYARQLKTGVHTHLAEHKDEVVFCLENFHLRPVEYLHHLGLVGENLLAAHCVAISEAEIDLISRSPGQFLLPGLSENTPPPGDRSGCGTWQRRRSPGRHQYF